MGDRSVADPWGGRLEGVEDLEFLSHLAGVEEVHEGAFGGGGGGRGGGEAGGDVFAGVVNEEAFLGNDLRE